VTFDIDCGVKLEAKEPSFAALSKIGSFFSQQSHTPVSYALAYWYGLRIEDRQLEVKPVRKASRFYEMASNFRQRVKASYPLFVRTEFRESGFVISLNQRESLLQSSNTKTALHQSYRDDLSISKKRNLIGRASPMSQFRISFEVVGYKAVDFSHLVYNGDQRGRPPGEE